MPAFTGHYKNSRQHRNASSSSLSSISPSITAPAHGALALGGGNALSSSRAKIYPREFRHTAPRSPHLSNTASPLLSALPNTTDLFPRSIPFPSFLSTSNTSANAPNSLGSASGGVGLGVGVSPPPSVPASYSSGGNHSGSSGYPRQIRGYPGFEEQLTSHHSAPGSNGGYYNSTQCYTPGSVIPLGLQFGGSQPQSRLQLGQGNYACTFDKLDEPFGGHAGAVASGGTGSGGGDNVICLGWEGGVDIWKVGRGVLEQVGRLEGLGGGVKSAKILPTPPRNDPLAALRPLICLTIHSPAVDHEVDPPIMQEAETPYSTSLPSRPSTSASNRSGQRSPESATDWQTRVEIWSLPTRTKVSSLFTSPVVPSTDFGSGIGSPWGGLRVEVSGSMVVVGVGISGEVYIFGLEGGERRKGSREQAEWKCLGKVWACIQVNSPGSFPSDSGVARGSPVDGQLGTPVFSLSNGWLAYCPAPAGSSIQAGGEVNIPYTSSSIKSQIPPTQPFITAGVSVEDEAFLNRVTREVAQELLRGAKWATEAGIKALQTYWNGNQAGSSPPSAPPLPNHTNGSTGSVYDIPNSSKTGLQFDSQPSGLGQQLRQMQQMGGAPPFQQPQVLNPAHHQSVNEPRLVSILDLNKILHGEAANAQQGLIPMVTFLPGAVGVSYMSFAPSGLALLTASSKGDSLFVWDLMRAVHHPPGNPPLGHKASPSLGSGLEATKLAVSPPGGLDVGRHVRQIARFNRMTVATIIEVGWSNPRGDKLTVVTEKGTVHFYDLPSGAYQWPPPRRPPPPSSVTANGANSGAVGAAGAAVSGAVNLLNSSTQPLLSAARRRRSGSGSMGSPNGGMFINSGGKNPARRGSGNGFPSDNSGSRVSLPQGFGTVTAGCVRFLVGKERGFVAVSGGGIIRIYEVRPGGGGSKKRKNDGGVVINNYLEYELPLLPDSPSQTQLSIEGEEKRAGGFWSGRVHHYHSRSEEQARYDQHPLSFAEIETNAVFQPFHTDRHVRLFVYTDSGSSNQLPQQHPQHVDDWQHDETRQDTQHRRRSKLGGSTPSSLSLSRPETPAPQKKGPTKKDATDMWVFGLPLPAGKLNVGSARGEVEFASDEGGLAEAMASKLQLEKLVNEVVKKGMKKGMKKGKRGKGGAFGLEMGMDKGFFEDDCEVLEYTGN